MKLTKIRRINQKGFGHVEALLGVLVVLVVAVVGVHVLTASHAATPPVSSDATKVVTPNKNISCGYSDDTWSPGDGYTINDLSSSSGNPASFSVKLNATPGNTAVNGYPDDQCILYSAIPKNEASAYSITPPVTPTTTVTSGDNGVAISAIDKSGTLDVASSTAFPTTGQVSVLTSGGSAVLAYTGTGTGTFTGITLVSGTSTWKLSTGNVATQAGLDYEFAYDIWLTTAAKAKKYIWPGDQELMIWTYTTGIQSNRIPVGNYTGKNLSNGANIWYGPTSTNKTVTVIEPTNKTSGYINISSTISQLQADGYVPKTNNGQLDMEYGIEAPYGGGNTFTVNSVSNGTLN